MSLSHKYPPVIFLGFVMTALLSCKTHDLYRHDRAIPQKIITDSSYTPGVPGEFTINDIALRDSLLTINLSYQDNKRYQEFYLYFDGVYQKTMPPHATLHLEKKGGKNKRGKTMTRQFLFDISVLKHPDYNQVVIEVYGYKKRMIFEY